MVVQKMTVREFEKFVEQHEDRIFELINGEIVEKVPSIYHAFIVAFLAGHLFMHLQRNPLGWTLVEGKVELHGDEDNAHIPDLAFVRETEDHPFETGKSLSYIPDLTVEVLSPKQSIKLMADKAAYYLKNGGQVVWLIYPEKQIIEVLRPPVIDAQ